VILFIKLLQDDTLPPELRQILLAGMLYDPNLPPHLKLLLAVLASGKE